MKGIELAARFALPPNLRSYCGAGGFYDAFAAYLEDKSSKNEHALERELSKFKAHYAYLRLIASACKKSPFDYKVAEALWIGNSLLSKVKKESISRLILEEFSGAGLLQRKKAACLAAGVPDGVVPHHSFHVLYLHSITGAVEKSIKTADMCRVSWGEVIGKKEGKVSILSQRLVQKGRALSFVICKKEVMASCGKIALLPELEKGDIVAVHWGCAVMKLNPRQAHWLEKCTRKNMAALQASKGQQASLNQCLCRIV